MKTTVRNYFIKTRRIGFSQWSEADIELAQKLWGNEKVTKFIKADGKFEKEEIRQRLINEVNNLKLHHVQYWPVFLLESNEFAGCCGLRPYSKEAVYEFGIHLLPEYWGAGFASEAAGAVINYAFDTMGVKQLFAGHHPDNIASAKFLKKQGFVYTHKEFYEPTGLEHPSYKYNKEIN